MTHLLVLVPSIYLFCLGLFGIYHRRHNIIMVLLSIEIMLLSVSISFVGFSCILKDLDGQIFSLFVLTEVLKSTNTKGLPPSRRVSISIPQIYGRNASLDRYC